MTTRQVYVNSAAKITWIVRSLLVVAVWTLLILDFTGVWSAPAWVYWPVWGAYTVMLVWGLVASFRAARKLRDAAGTGPSWRRTDSRTAEGDERG